MSGDSARCPTTTSRTYCDELGSAGIDRSTIAYRLFAVTGHGCMRQISRRRQTAATDMGTRGGRSTHSDRPIGPVRTRRCPSILKPCLRLLIWAMRFVEDFSTDIIAAKALKSVPQEVGLELAELAPYDRVRRYLDQRRETTQAAPDCS